MLVITLSIPSELAACSKLRIFGRIILYKEYGAV